MTHTVPIFVYGTLRAGEALAHLLPDSASRYGGTVRGRLHYAPGTNSYPVLLPGDKDDRVYGELLYLDLDDRDVQYVMLMEVGSGYSATWADVTLDGDTAPVRSLVFTWHPRDGYGTHIEGGSWPMRTPRQYECHNCGWRHPSQRDADECAQDDDDQYDAYLAACNQSMDADVDRILARHDS
jgi:gamma-glutamylcyclotransferase (GGCT)/AIG2-like uncharacterized protein YtfP